MTELQQHSLKVNEALRLAVAKALETKRRLGHYAVIFRDGKPVRVPPEELRKPKG